MSETVAQPDETLYFVAMGACGHLVGCAIDRPKYAIENTRFVAFWIRAGLRIEKRAVSDVRTAEWCDCKRLKQKGTNR